MFFVYFTILNFKLKNNIRSIVISVILGATIEILQATMTDNRSGDILDMFANILGILSASILFKRVKRYLTAILSTLN